MEPDTDLALLRRSFDVARRSRDAGDHPFGSLIVIVDREGDSAPHEGQINGRLLAAMFGLIKEL